MQQSYKDPYIQVEKLWIPEDYLEENNFDEALDHLGAIIDDFALKDLSEEGIINGFAILKFIKSFYLHRILLLRKYSQSIDQDTIPDSIEISIARYFCIVKESSQFEFADPKSETEFAKIILKLIAELKNDLIEDMNSMDNSVYELQRNIVRHQDLINSMFNSQCTIARIIENLDEIECVLKEMVVEIPKQSGVNGILQ